MWLGAPLQSQIVNDLGITEKVLYHGIPPVAPSISRNIREGRWRRAVPRTGISLLHPSEPLHGNPPLAAVVFWQDSARITDLQTLARTQGLPDTDNSYTIGIHEDKIIPLYSIHVACVAELFPRSRVSPPHHQLFSIVSPGGSRVAVCPIPSVPIMDETTASLAITVEGMEVVERWRKQGCWEQKRRWPAERKEGVARLEFRRPPPPPRGWEALGQATESRSRTRACRRSPCDDASPLSTSFAFFGEADRSTESGQLGALLRREGLYSSHLTAWRKQRNEGTLAGLEPKRRGRKASPDAPLIAENERLQRDNQRLTARLRQAETIIEVQKKLSEILGIPLPPPDSNGSMP